MNSTSSDNLATNQQVLVQNEAIERSLHWQLNTLIGTGISYFLFSCLLVAFASQGELLSVALTPLIIYDVQKIVVCCVKLYQGLETESRDYTKDVIECSLMILYKVKSFR